MVFKMAYRLVLFPLPDRGAEGRTGEQPGVKALRAPGEAPGREQHEGRGRKNREKHTQGRQAEAEPAGENEDPAERAVEQG